MTEKEAAKRFLKELPFRTIKSIKPHKNGWLIIAPDKNVNDDYSGIIFFVNSKGVKKLSVVDILSMEEDFE